MDDWLWVQNVIFPLVGMGMATLGGFGVYRIVMRWLDRRHERLMVAQGGAVPSEVAELRARMEAVEEVARRVPELEERLDFTERLLTQPQRERLPSAGPGER
ncbi:MAG TPA: hypothetical protein VF970_06505 [Gemmatimonadales bacterium]